jgi:hypothetical protein
MASSTEAAGLLGTNLANFLEARYRYLANSPLRIPAVVNDHLN